MSRATTSTPRRASGVQLVLARLRAAGWIMLVLWEHDDPSTTADVIERAVREQVASEA